eukprot:1147214-Pelagomonas_calceolata.AAC.1
MLLYTPPLLFRARRTQQRVQELRVTLIRAAGRLGLRYDSEQPMLHAVYWLVSAYAACGVSACLSPCSLQCIGLSQPMLHAAFRPVSAHAACSVSACLSLCRMRCIGLSQPMLLAACQPVSACAVRRVSLKRARSHCSQATTVLTCCVGSAHAAPKGMPWPWLNKGAMPHPRLCLLLTLCGRSDPL